jgi:hypothetical protein
MAAITLSSVWISTALTPSRSVQLAATSIVETPTVTGAVRGYANGRQRAITSASRPRSIALAFTLVTSADAATLASWVGQLVLLRDPFGMKVWGSYFALPRTQQNVPGVNDITMTLTEITHSEAT